jgi:hypothetical protein
LLTPFFSNLPAFQALKTNHPPQGLPNKKRRPCNAAADLAEKKGMKTLAVVWASPLMRTDKY